MIKIINAMKLKIISVCLLFISILISCKKEPLSVAGNSDVLLLSNVIIDNQSCDEYLYNDANLISEEKSKYDYTLHNWLQNFVYNMRLCWWVFLFAGLTAFRVAFLTVSWQSWRGETRNPVKGLRYE